MKLILEAIKSLFRKIETALSKIEAKLSSMEKWCVNPDWNQNDETAADYVKNRPFWTGDPVETVLIEKTSMEWTSADFERGLLLNPIELIEGETYKVHWDGTVYECVAYIAEGPNSPSLGDGAIAGAGNSGSNDEPFFITVYGETCVFAAEIGSHTFSILGNSSLVHQIDKKYLPNGFVSAPIIPEICAYMVRLRNLGIFFTSADNTAYEFFRSFGGEETLPASLEQWQNVWNVFRAASAGKLVLFEDLGDGLCLLYGNASTAEPLACTYDFEKGSMLFSYDEESGLITKTEI